MLDSRSGGNCNDYTWNIHFSMTTSRHENTFHYTDPFWMENHWFSSQRGSFDGNFMVNQNKLTVEFGLRWDALWLIWHCCNDFIIVKFYHTNDVRISSCCTLNKFCQRRWNASHQLTGGLFENMQTPHSSGRPIAWNIWYHDICYVHVICKHIDAYVRTCIYEGLCARSRYGGQVQVIIPHRYCGM